jgi:CheY-like chemotaxis protein
MSRHPTGRADATPLVRPAAKTVVLIVDPDDDTRALYREFLEHNACEVVEASDGREALTKALVRPPALVVAELVLPFVDGYALCEILRRDQATAHVPILVVTGQARAAELSRARRSGASAVVVKPATPEQLWMETQRLLEDATDVGDRATRSDAPVVPAAAAEVDQPVPRSSPLSKAFARFTTTTPASDPPALFCPACDKPLVYHESYVGGVSERHREQWDHYMCPGACGVFAYRQRTRKLRHLK